MENKRTNKDQVLSPEELNNVKEAIDKSELDTKIIQIVRDTYKKQKEEKKTDGSGWDFWDERAHIENILCQRFNYLILCYSLFITAFSVIPGRWSKTIILIVGLIVVFLISLLVRRAWYKLDVNLKFLYVLYDEYNGIYMIDKIVENKYSKGIDTFIIDKVKYNRLIGKTTPIIMCFSLFIGSLFVGLGWWNVDDIPCSQPNPSEKPPVTSPIVPSVEEPTYYPPTNNNNPVQLNPISVPKPSQTPTRFNNHAH